ncbi:phosphoethanolamine transferase EptA [Enterovibrio sp. ZSDZ35]|uniref:Phosphoethanolamine transferase EptA n=1 Tax=Enterovibrio qingdaonensis TaxID=2899818 RepID=A0ABT5QJD7_9GAMM|nr:phosphoethanolamine transferase EptA [Enterovibrio sp. ZSDZ35]MDD1780783.1 phosphoethanolamine transferase EptA [Enterovibrio sp. ZSDZ35]
MQEYAACDVTQGLVSPMKRQLSSAFFIFCIALFFASVQNTALWQHLWQILTASQHFDIAFLATIPVLILALCFAIFTLLVWPIIYKPIVIALLACSTLATYAMVSYGQYFNYGMIVNIFETNSSEATSYLSVSVFLWLLFLFFIPSVFVLLTKVRFPSTFRGLLAQKLVMLIVSVAVVGAIASVYYKDYASLVRNNSEIKALINPTNYLSASFRYAKYRLYEKNIPFKTIGTDAKDMNTSGAPNVIVLVVGETSRAMNYSLNGYDRDTNPHLSKQGVVSFQHVTSCGTATAVSVPCMFSIMTHDSYNATTARHQEGVLDVLKHANVDVSWIDNDGGCKGVCDRVEHMNIDASAFPKSCSNGTCYDDVLLNGLADRVRNAKQDTVIILHLMGSHGPTYFERYPPEFRIFTPSCDTADIQNCSRQEVLNTYDNTIVYTDYILSQVIDILKGADQSHQTAMLYLSDHGESLGEDGIYLHGLPYGIAPKEQKSVPMILWMSPLFKEDHKVDLTCLEQNAKENQYSQDNLFHTLLGMASVSTKVYQPSLDMLYHCEKHSDAQQQPSSNLAN